jgi:hypothetical protein
MKTLVRLIAIIALVGLGYWLWTVFFPNDKAIILKRVNRLATLLSFDSREGNIARVANVEEAANLFSQEVEIVIDTPGRVQETLDSRQELRQRAFAVRTMLSGMEVKFLDLSATLSYDHDSATVHLTGEVRVSGEGELFVQEFKFHLRKIEGKWLIVRVETVRTLT